MLNSTRKSSAQRGMQNKNKKWFFCSTIWRSSPNYSMDALAKRIGLEELGALFVLSASMLFTREVGEIEKD